MTTYISPRGYFCTIRGQKVTGDLKRLSEIYCEKRDAKCEGMNTFPPVEVYEIGGGHQIGHISYNGRVWPGTCWSSGARPLYDNRIDLSFG